MNVASSPESPAYRLRVRLPLTFLLAASLACTVPVRYVNRGGPHLDEEYGHCHDVMSELDVKECTDGERIRHPMMWFAIIVGGLVASAAGGLYWLAHSGFGR